MPMTQSRFAWKPSLPGPEPKKIFVAYPFSILPEDDYRAVYAAVQTEYFVEFVFADQEITGETILFKIDEMIRTSEFSLFDVTGWNANVTLEFGIAYGRRETFRILFNPDHSMNPEREVLSDVRGMDRLEYRTYAQLRVRLSGLLANLGFERRADAEKRLATRLQTASGLVVEPTARSATVDGKRIQLSEAEFAVLWELLSNAGSVLTFDQLRERALRSRSPAAVQTVEGVIRSLERKLRGALPIMRMWGIGYQVHHPNEHARSRDDEDEWEDDEWDDDQA